jgi:fatty-acyl-CoA synthase
MQMLRCFGRAGSRIFQTQVIKKPRYLDQTLPSMLKKCVEKNPAAIAHIIEATDRQISWSEVQQAQQELSSLLQQRYGVIHGDFVWYMASRPVAEIQAMMASARCGSIFAPINVLWQHHQIERYAKLMKPKVAIVEEKYKRTMDDMGIPCIVLPEKDEFVQHTSHEFDRVHLSSSDPVIIKFTSGTTSLPKIVKHSHQSLLIAGEFAFLSHEVPHTPEERTVLFMRAGSFINAALYGWNLVHSATLIHQEFDLTKWPRLFREYGVTCQVMFGRAMLEICKMQQPFPTLKVVIYGGLPVPTTIVKGVNKLCPNALLVHGYGMTESGGGTLYHIYDGTEDDEFSTLPLSKPYPGVEWKLGSGSRNELLVKTPAMTSGYHGNEEANNELFQNGWLHTGDVAKFDKQGFLHVVDRLKDIIINIDGNNIFPIDIENVLLQHPNVVECAVVGKNLEPGQVPVAFVIASEKVSAEELRVHCENNLDSRHIPTEFLFMDSFPKTDNNKIRKVELKRLIG